MLRRAASLVQLVLGSRSHKPLIRKPLHTVRLTFEVLETRLVPADIVWSGAGFTNEASDPANWVGNQLPTAQDNIVFDTNVGSAVLDPNFLSTVAALKITSAYTGTVTLQQDITVTAAFP
jgi:hypothetical protein